ncbi:hypothetical protein KFL_000480250 [Klebsormidium nitens]|uniref:PITH domain-containing protein n=1 Tax=Klebsormidium nitens TaxID=105231 RepID=A0A1Y1HNG6_KLENI|nr:hypothetical protein KFL_000480250 [Klebsormidium nitens]|eukprot:GAQ80184.1 hypothetical protein KFL_000480250 [Klebsormidium nitens]
MACAHNHDCEDSNCAADWSLYKNVDLPKVRALNEQTEGSVKTVLKPWDQRLDFGTILESNPEDPELLVVIPFISDIKLKGICIIGGADGTSPTRMRAFTNREDIDFSNVNDLTPVQEWELAENVNGELEYQTRFARFQGVSTLILHFPASISGDQTRVHFIGLKGEATQLQRDKVVNVVYEVTPQPQDHKMPTENQAPSIL